MQSKDSNIPAFPSFPCTSRYVALGAIEEAVARVSRAIDTREAAALVIGPPGTGKSLLCGLIQKQYQPTHQVVVIGETPLEDRDAMLRHLIHHLGVDKSSIQDGDVHLALVDYINNLGDDSEGLIIIVDEAQKLSADVIESIRMITNITRDGEPRVFALLCGGVKLDETLVDSSLESFTQRAATRCYLHPMNGSETRYYIQQTIRNCGADPESTITGEAIAAIHHACDGVPRLVNQLVTQAIDCAADADETLINETFVDRAWAELQQLPSPMVDEPRIASSATAIEFGELDDLQGHDSRESIQWCDDEKMVAMEISAPDSSGQMEGNETELGSYEPEPYRSETSRGQTACRKSVNREHRLGAESGYAEPRDIELESPFALWVDEPNDEYSPDHHFAHHSSIDQPNTNNQLPVGLFGEFEVEEEISVGSGFATRQVASVGVPANLELLLQQEIVGGGAQIRIAESDPDPDQIQINADQEIYASSDDSDLLVIEDEVAVLPMNSHSIESAKGPVVSVNFQAMLSKMRGPN